MNEYMESRVVIIILVNSPENDISILTKTLSAKLHEKHTKKMVGAKLEGISSFGKVKTKGDRDVFLTSNI